MCSDEDETSDQIAGDDDHGRRRGKVRGTALEEFAFVRSAAVKLCNELLKQSMQSLEFEMTLGCASAVIGVRPRGNECRNVDVAPVDMLGQHYGRSFTIELYADQSAEDVGGEEWAMRGRPYMFKESQDGSIRRSQPTS